MIRGGAGYFNITTSGALYYALEQTLQQNYQNVLRTTTPPAPTLAAIRLERSWRRHLCSPTRRPVVSSRRRLGSVYFYAAVDPHWHDPYSLQQDLSIDHDFGRNFGGRISYIGMHTWHQVWQPQFNQLARSSTRQASAAAATDYPFPNFYQITRRSPGCHGRLPVVAA